MPHRVDQIGFAGIDATRGETIQRCDRISDARLGERERAPGRGAHLYLALTVHQTVQPEIKCDQWNAGQKGTDDDRKNIPARKSAH